MAKITRYTGNLRAFGVDAPGVERTIFGSPAGSPIQSDDLTTNINANFLQGWGTLPLGDKPPREWFNGLAFTATQLAAYLHQMGVAEWDAEQEYNEGSLVILGSSAFQSKSGDNVGNDPSTDIANWSLAFSSLQTASDIISTSEGFPAGTIIQVGGFYTIGDSNVAGWRATGNVITVSQSPAQTGDGTLSDASGREYKIVTDTLTPEMLGAAADGVTNDGPVFVAALTYLDSSSETHLTIRAARYYCESDLVVPSGCAIVGPVLSPGSTDSNAMLDLSTVVGAILLNTANSITLGYNSAVSQLYILNPSLSASTPDASGYDGEPIIVAGDYYSIIDVLIAGYKKALNPDGFQSGLIKGLRLDCNPDASDAAIRINNSFDSTVLRDVHAWPYGTIAAYTNAIPSSTPAAEAYRLHRTGAALRLTGANDDTLLDNILAYGYQNNFVLESDSFRVGKIWSDNTSFHAGSVGVRFGPGTKVSCGEVVSWHSEQNAVFSMLPTQFLSIEKLTLSGGTASNCEFFDGDVHISAMESVNSTQAFKISSTASRVKIGTLSENGNTFAQVVDVTVPNVEGVSLQIDSLRSDKADSSSLIGNNQLIVEPIASADPLPLPISSKFIRITGTTGFGNISGEWAGRQIKMTFDDTLTVFDGANINLAGDFVTSAGSTLELVHNGSNWVEVSRSSN